METDAIFVTPPNIYLPVDGLRITLLGSNQEWIEELADHLEQIFPVMNITLYHLDENTKDSWEWQMAMANLSDFIFVEAGSASQQELLLAFLNQGNKLWFGLEHCENLELIKLLNTVGANMFDTFEGLSAMLRTFISND